MSEWLKVNMKMFAPQISISGPHLLLSGLFDDVKVLRRGVEVGVGVEQVRHKRQVQLLVAIFDVL